MIRTLLRLFERGELFPSASTRRFREFNQHMWDQRRREGRSTVLVELASGAPTSLTFSYVSNVLALRLGANVAALAPSKSKFYYFNSSLYWLLYRFFWRFVSEQGRVYRSFGALRLVHPRNRWKLSAEARECTRLFFDSSPTKRDLERFKVRGVQVGDLFYDTYLRTSGQPTVILSDRRFKWFFACWVKEALYWADTMQDGRVAAVIVSHSVYNLAVPLRMALNFGVPGYQAGGGGVKRLTRDKPRPEAFFSEFPVQFRTLPFEDQESGLAEAKRRIAERFHGKLGIDMTYQRFSPFGQPNKSRLIRESPNPKILVATHCFSDAPHFYGMNLFPDFWEWMVFLGGLTEETEFDWYLKSHPDCHAANSNALAEIVERFPRFSILPVQSSHHQLIDEGITAALTVYGTIGFEYAALGVPVINASINNPHVGYDFNFHPGTVEEYKDLVLAAADLRKPGKTEFAQVLEYYFMTHLYSADSNPFGIDFREHRRMVVDTSPYRDDLMFDGFLDSWSSRRHLAAIDYFRTCVLDEQHLT